MLIPIGTDRPHRPPLVTPILIGLNVLIFLGQLIYQRLNGEQAYYRALEPLMISGPGFQVWQLITYAFLHAGWLHVLGNMVALWVFGPDVEDRLTRPGFVIFYICGGMIAGGLHALFEKNPALGASGAVAAV